MSTAGKSSFLADVVSGKAHGTIASAVGASLALAAPVYGCMMRARAAAYASGMLPSATLARPAISVGNITTGGTGKTPFVRLLIGELRCLGHRPAVLTRGYHSGPTGHHLGDEGQMISTMTAVPVGAGSNRAASAIRLLAHQPAISTFILDDGFQHLRIRRNLDILLISAAAPWGRADHIRRCLPGGLMREPLAAVRRAHLIVITRSDQFPTERTHEIAAVLRKAGACAQILRGAHGPAGFRSSTTPADVAPDITTLAGSQALAVCGIGEPESFFGQLRGLGIRLIKSAAYPDHHHYTKDDLAAINSAASTADAIITTEKDWVKLSPLSHAITKPIYRLDVQMSLTGLASDSPKPTDNPEVIRARSDQALSILRTAITEAIKH